MTIAGATEVMRGHDVVMVIGAQVFRYYPYVAGDYLPEGTELLQITSDPGLAGAAPVGESILGDSRLALEKLLDTVTDAPGRAAPAPLARKHTLPDIPSSPLTPPEVYAALSALYTSGGVNGELGISGRLCLRTNGAAATRSGASFTASSSFSNASLLSPRRLSPTGAAPASPGSDVICSSSVPSGR